LVGLAGIWLLSLGQPTHPAAEVHGWVFVSLFVAAGLTWHAVFDARARKKFFPRLDRAEALNREM
jgi:hypothetical protein